MYLTLYKRKSDTPHQPPSNQETHPAKEKSGGHLGRDGGAFSRANLTDSESSEKHKITHGSGERHSEQNGAS